MTSSQFLLEAVISLHLSQTSRERSLIAQKQENSFYVYNCVTSVNNEEELRDFIEVSTEMLGEAKIDLRMWAFGPLTDNENFSSNDLKTDTILDEPNSVLGLLWNRK